MTGCATQPDCQVVLTTQRINADCHTAVLLVGLLESAPVGIDGSVILGITA